MVLVGSGLGGLAAVLLAADPPPVPADGERCRVHQVVTVGAPDAHAPRVPAGTRVLSFEDRAEASADPDLRATVARLRSLGHLRSP